MRGVDFSKAPTSPNTVLDIKNLDVDYDGGLVLRKPILCENSWENIDIVFPLFDREDYLTISDKLLNFTPRDFYVYDIYDNRHSVTNKTQALTYIDCSNANLVNTPTSTLIYNCKVDLKGLSSLVDADLYNTSAVKPEGYDIQNVELEPTEQYRIIRIHKENYGYVATIMPISINTLTETDFPFDYNMALHYPLALRDGVGSPILSVTGIFAYESIADTLEKDGTVDMLTESQTFWRLYDSSKYSGKTLCLKAFLNIPDSILEKPIGVWEYSTDGVEWKEISREADSEVTTVPTAYYDIVNNELDNSNSIKWTVNTNAYSLILGGVSAADVTNATITSRPNCLVRQNLDRSLLYRFSIYSTKSLKDLPYGNPELPEGVSEENVRVKDVLLSFKLYNFTKTETAEDVKFDQPLSGKMIYYKNSLYSYSKDFKNIVYVSDTDSTVFPISKVLDVRSVQDAYVTNVVPWRDYLIVTTNKDIHLATPQEIGFTSKIVSTFIGVPESDSRTCASILNGIVFKSGSKIFTLHPDMSSGSETILNLSEISKPVEHILTNIVENEQYKPFSFVTPEAYYLFIPSENNTQCLKYNFTHKLWTHYEYPVVLYDYVLTDIQNIKLLSKKDGNISIFTFDRYGDTDTQGDVLEKTVADVATVVTPIQFYVDSGQKTDNISLTKQFVETKIIASTLEPKDSFKLDVRIDIDGNLFTRHVDLNTDGALIRDNPNQVITLGTTSEVSDITDAFNTMRQMFLRYSGKGKTIRHIVSGESLYKFKIYELFYRYKILNVKQ